MYKKQPDQTSVNLKKRIKALEEELTDMSSKFGLLTQELFILKEALSINDTCTGKTQSLDMVGDSYYRGDHLLSHYC